ncbi:MULTISPECIES: phage holin family protein [Lacticaseibacillus]|uniref:Phage holin family protein n=5 Tax=Lacticaseibacillus TaxID=2759736 RepID=A0AAN1C892_LACCA|nr:MULTISPECIES: phage holin family protein [Lacticaseibacillus]ARY91038.1 hypothetical protein BGL52_04490 [Lacticaseibacillus casei]KAB1969214.1 phage holin family protein [Lacticaseibacillus casei]KRK12912.1 membrane protein [Lacticaseibacillus zeae DSM 20178 = KCTC 3804]MDE3281934.1 phage holin family protein [Lacticaseibacillus casei]OLS05947.1 hypothetical protein AUQ39_11480 [Lacticaseibacillus casei]
MNFIKRTIITTAVFLIYAQLFPSQLYVAGFGVAVVGALVLGVLNGLLRPILVILSIPITILTLGLFLIVLNGLMLSMMTWFVPGIVFSGFGSTMVLAIIISVMNMIFVGKK